MKRKTIRAHRDFLATRNGTWTECDYFIIRINPVKIPGDPRYGIIVPKKVFKLATVRNRVKRVIRDWVFANEDFMMDYYDYVFIVREPVLSLSRDEGRRIMREQMQKLSKLYYV